MNRGVLSALGAAALFGASTPFAKMLLGSVDPWLLAGILYLASGIGLHLLRLLSPGRHPPLAAGEGWWLAGAIACGGVIAPVLLMMGLRQTAGSVASLLLNAEGVITALLAWFVFHENFDRRVALGMAAIVAGAVLLSWSGETGAAADSVWGPLAILGACACWGLDNNLTRKVSLADPLRIAGLKGLAAGSVNTLIALGIQASLPPLPSVALAAVLGILGYGFSLALFVEGLRHLGAARAGAYFSTAPFVGAAIAVIALGEPVTNRLIAAGALMAIGLWLHLAERHEHDHQHEAMEHDHAHRHDEHHDHSHDQAGEVEGEHRHPHRHHALRHGHPHYPDSHHRHIH
jgi:drug/metabolite transporter (DMT)-like permease